MQCLYGEIITNLLFSPTNFEEKDDEILVPVTKEEKFAILAQFPKTHFVRTMKQKSKRHHYYCEEAPQVMRYLNRIRKGGASAAGTATRRK